MYVIKYSTGGAASRLQLKSNYCNTNRRFPPQHLFIYIYIGICAVDLVHEIQTVKYVLEKKIFIRP